MVAAVGYGVFVIPFFLPTFLASKQKCDRTDLAGTRRSGVLEFGIWLLWSGLSGDGRRPGTMIDRVP